MATLQPPEAANGQAEAIRSIVAIEQGWFTWSHRHLWSLTATNSMKPQLCKWAQSHPSNISDGNLRKWSGRLVHRRQPAAGREEKRALPVGAARPEVNRPASGYPILIDWLTRSGNYRSITSAGGVTSNRKWRFFSATNILNEWMKSGSSIKNRPLFFLLLGK